jgi:hypothetical protein
MQPPKPDAAEIARALALILEPGQVTELLALNVSNVEYSASTQSADTSMILPNLPEPRPGSLAHRQFTSHPTL